MFLLVREYDTVPTLLKETRYIMGSRFRAYRQRIIDGLQGTTKTIEVVQTSEKIKLKIVLP